MKSLRLTGIGLHIPQMEEFIAKKPNVAWVEVPTENYFAEGGKSIFLLQQTRRDYPVSLHGMNLSLGSTDELNWHHLKQLRDLIKLIDPGLVSDHLAWSSLHGHYFHDLLPLPFTEETLNHVVNRIQQIQDYLKRQILIENIASYVKYNSANIPEDEFLIAIAKQSGCGILLDINNVYINASNLRYNPYVFLKSIPKELIQQFHLSGFSTTLINHQEWLVGTHDRPIVSAVWDLYRFAIEHLGCKPTIIEWDNNLPALDTLCLEAYRAEKILRETYATNDIN